MAHTSFCVTRRRQVVLVDRSVADDLVAQIVPMVRALSVGKPEDDCDITPVVSESSATFIEGLVDDAREKGGRRHCTYYMHAHAYNLT